MQSHNRPAPGSPAPPQAVLSMLATAAGRQGAGDVVARLAELRAWLSGDLGAIENTLSKLQPPAANSAYTPVGVAGAAQHLLALPGKRVRALCVLLGARQGQADPQKIQDLAIAAELVHAATLLHDDVIDCSDERRSAPSSRVVYGNAASVLAGDHLLVEALSRINRTGFQDLQQDMLDVLRDMVAGEALQLERRGRFQPDRDLYLEIVRGKTARLFCWSMRAGARAAQAGSAVEAALDAVGESLGTAFQLVDDLLDLEGDAAVMGKDPLADLREGKLTWPWLLAAERDPDLLTAIQAAVDDPEAPFGVLIERARALDVVNDTKAFALAYADKAHAALDTLPDIAPTRAVRCVVDAAVHRVR